MMTKDYTVLTRYTTMKTTRQLMKECIEECHEEIRLKAIERVRELEEQEAENYDYDKALYEYECKVIEKLEQRLILDPLGIPEGMKIDNGPQHFMEAV